MKVHWTPFENASTSGAPDLHGCRSGKDIWLELKAPADGQKPHVRPSQVAWHLARHHAGGVSYFLVEYRRRWYLFLGREVSRLREAGLQAPCIAAMAQGDYHRLLHQVTQDPDRERDGKPEGHE